MKNGHKSLSLSADVSLKGHKQTVVENYLYIFFLKKMEHQLQRSTFFKKSVSHVLHVKMEQIVAAILFCSHTSFSCM